MYFGVSRILGCVFVEPLCNFFRGRVACCVFLPWLCAVLVVYVSHSGLFVDVFCFFACFDNLGVLTLALGSYFLRGLFGFERAYWTHSTRYISTRYEACTHRRDHRCPLDYLLNGPFRADISLICMIYRSSCRPDGSRI